MSLAIGSELPSFSGATSWLCEQDVAANKPVLVHFWAMSCAACKSSMPKVISITEKYRGKGLQVIAVHMPRGNFDLDVDKVEDSYNDLGMVGACAIDNNHTVGDLFETGGVWPVYFLYDDKHHLKRRAAGGVGVSLMEAALEKMCTTE